MSSQRGNGTRTRAQKHQNNNRYKNDMHDTSHTKQMLNSMDLSAVCGKCEQVIRWKITYNKYKPLKAPGTCVNCKEKKVKRAYLVLCDDCARVMRKCPKCLTVRDENNVNDKSEPINDDDDDDDDD